MNIKNKIIVIMCSSVIGLGAFVMSTQYANMDAIMVQWKDTVNGSYTRNVAVAQHSKAVEKKEEMAEQNQDSLQLPDSGEHSALAEAIAKSNISKARKDICLEAIDTVSKGCIYHGLRAGNGTSTNCALSNCDATSVGAYDFKTQANYNLEDPIYLDCSFFVKHCYWKAGYEMISSNTSGIYTGGEFETISKEQLQPADIAVRSNGRSGHVLIYLGDGVWAEMQNHKEDAVISKKDPMSDSRYIARRFKALGGA